MIGRLTFSFGKGQVPTGLSHQPTNIFLSVREFDTLLSIVSLGVSQYFLIGTISHDITSY